jgi:hypothetical protein
MAGGVSWAAKAEPGPTPECLRLMRLSSTIRLFQLENGHLPKTLHELEVAPKGPYAQPSYLTGAAGELIQYEVNPSGTSFRLALSNTQLIAGGKCASKS